MKLARTEHQPKEKLLPNLAICEINKMMQTNDKTSNDTNK
ncbi:17_t:CDS:2 [Dentiscutata heterogama]|uniref:17_t:CDS:1 n=1 Tax=Dentiscutata heterogama TaxID=1316150 RepID=A0ACA9KPF4_9GLOM|nr:17_t:CDS:2 [Dentiscutata heterogama]